MDIPCDETGTLKLQWEDPTGEDYIEPGEYTVTEVIPPPGYEMSEESQNLRLWLEDKDGDGIQEPIPAVLSFSKTSLNTQLSFKR